jgi:hypothetical protein
VDAAQETRSARSEPRSSSGTIPRNLPNEPRPTPDIEDARPFVERKPLGQALASFEL